MSSAARRSGTAWHLCLALTAMVVGATLVIWGCARPKETSSGKLTTAPHPLPKKEKPTEKLGDPVDNGRCFVCHLNYDGEQLVTIHAAQGVGCETCHGSSDEHCDDEEHITPPQIMYPRKKINAACLGCHVDIKPTEDEAKWAALMGANVCTNCHGRHRLTSRKRVWDKETGKVLE